VNLPVIGMTIHVLSKPTVMRCNEGLLCVATNTRIPYVGRSTGIYISLEHPLNSAKPASTCHTVHSSLPNAPP
jgi:hypothetical protein